MTSKLQVDSLEGRTTKGSVVVMGESNGKTTNLQQGLAKCWAFFNGSGTIAISDSFNCSGLTDDGTGDYDIDMTNVHANTNYSVSLVSGDYHCGHGGNEAAGKFNMESYNSSHASADMSRVHGQSFGDLA